MSKNDSDSSSISKNWELNQYELNRIPHEIINDDTEIAISPQILQNELLCPICLDILKRTMTTKECLHRFCHDCIITALRAGNKECPTCRKKLASKRSLRPDLNFDGIIAKIYPNREEYDAMHERVLEKLRFKKVLNNMNQKSLARQNRLVNKVEEQNSVGTSSNRVDDEENSMDVEANNVTSNQKQVEKQHNRNSKRAAHLNQQNSDADSDMESRTSTEQSSSLHTENNIDEVEIVLKPHPLREFNTNLNRFIKTTSNATVIHLSKYLWTRLNVDIISQASSPASSSSKSSNQIKDSKQNGTISSSSVTAASISNNENSISDFQIYFSSNESKMNCYHLLNEDNTLDQVIDKHWKHNRPLELYYYNQKLNSKHEYSSSNGNNIGNHHEANNGVSSCSSSTSSK